MNFAKNSICLQCDSNRPKRQLLPGEWECPEYVSCCFVNIFFFAILLFSNMPFYFQIEVAVLNFHFPDSSVLNCCADK